MVAGVALAAGAVALMPLPGPVLTPVRIACFVVGLLLAGGAIWRRLAMGLGETFSDRLEPAALVAAAAGVALLASLALDVGNPREPLFDTTRDGVIDEPAYIGAEDELPRYYNRNYDPGWDSVRWMLLVGVAVALAGAVLVLLPPTGRKVAISLALIYHFAGILTASASAPAPKTGPPWLPSVIWNYAYRPYLTFVYLNNAYHFYSPEPGPCTMLWYRVEFSDGSARWLRVSDREDSPTRLEYQRLLAITELVNQTEEQPALKVNRLGEARQVAGIDFRIPMHPIADPGVQYRELTPAAKAHVVSYVNHVARTVKHETNPDLKPQSIKVYRVTHDIMRPGDLANGLDPRDPTLYYVWFNGEFTPQGPPEAQEWALRNHREVPGWENLEQDPFLYWLLPIFRRPKNPHAPSDKQEWELVDCLKRHAGDSAIPAWDTWPAEPPGTNR